MKEKENSTFEKLFQVIPIGSINAFYFRNSQPLSIDPTYLILMKSQEEYFIHYFDFFLSRLEFNYRVKLADETEMSYITNLFKEILDDSYTNNKIINLQCNLESIDGMYYLKIKFQTP